MWLQISTCCLEFKEIRMPVLCTLCMLIVVKFIELWTVNVNLPSHLSVHQGTWHLRRLCDGQSSGGDRATGSELDCTKPWHKALLARHPQSESRWVRWPHVQQRYEKHYIMSMHFLLTTSMGYIGGISLKCCNLPIHRGPSFPSGASSSGGKGGGYTLPHARYSYYMQSGQHREIHYSLKGNFFFFWWSLFIYFIYPVFNQDGPTENCSVGEYLVKMGCKGNKKF